MYSDAQKQYLQDVLGVSVMPVASARATVPRLVVLTNPLNGDEMALFNKILAAAHVTDFIHHQLKDFSRDTVAPEFQGRNVLAFDGATGRHSTTVGTWWSVPHIAEMMGAGPAVADLKKLAWNAVQLMVKEL